jgi:hypothetical protein
MSTLCPQGELQDSAGTQGCEVHLSQTRAQSVPVGTEKRGPPLYSHSVAASGEPFASRWMVMLREMSIDHNWSINGPRGTSSPYKPPGMLCNIPNLWPHLRNHHGQQT